MIWVFPLQFISTAVRLNAGNKLCLKIVGVLKVMSQGVLMSLRCPSALEYIWSHRVLILIVKAVKFVDVSGDKQVT